MRTQHHVVWWMLHEGKRAAFRNMRLYGADLRQLPLVGIAPKWTHGPEGVGGIDPGGLRRFLHIGLDVWVDLRGRGGQLGARHTCWVLPAAVWFGVPVSEQDQSATSTGEKPHPRFQWWCTKAEGARLLRCRMTESSDSLRRESACVLDVESSSIRDWYMRTRSIWDSRVVTMQRQELDQPDRLESSYITKMVEVNDLRFFRRSSSPSVRKHLKSDRLWFPKVCLVHKDIHIFNSSQVARWKMDSWNRDNFIMQPFQTGIVCRQE